MASQQRPPRKMPAPSSHRALHNNFHETDSEFVERQFRVSIEALLHAQALEPGEFEALIQQPANSDKERETRASHHEHIARRVLLAVQQRLLAEEDFNIWSGRRREHNQQVRFRFEQAYANAFTPRISCMRGALTAIVRTYIRLQDDLIAELIELGGRARTAEELLQVEEQAVNYGFLEFERYSHGTIDGWPSFLRSTGRFRGATRLRQYFEERQSALPMSSPRATALSERITRDSMAHEFPSIEQPTHTTTDATPPIEAPATPCATAPPPSSIRRILSQIARMFRSSH